MIVSGAFRNRRLSNMFGFQRKEGGTLYTPTSLWKYTSKQNVTFVLFRTAFLRKIFQSEIILLKSGGFSLFYFFIKNKMTGVAPQTKLATLGWNNKISQTTVK